MKISLIICTYNRADQLDNLLKRLDSLEHPRVRLEKILVDNNSTDSTFSVARLYPAWRYVREREQGLSHARNAGITVASGEWVIFTDDDVEPDMCYLKSLDYLVGFRDAVGFGGRVIPTWPRDAPRWFTQVGPYRLQSQGTIVGFDLGPTQKAYGLSDNLPFPVGANMGFSRDAIMSVGGFNTKIGRSGKKNTIMFGEDTEAFNKVCKSGGQIAYIPECLVYHPVDNERLKIVNYTHSTFQMGRYIALSSGGYAGQKIFGGVPRYLVRFLMTQSLHALWGCLTMRPRKCMYHFFKTVFHLGQLTQYRSTATALKLSKWSERIF